MLGAIRERVVDAGERARVLSAFLRHTGMASAASLRGLKGALVSRQRPSPSLMMRYHAANTPHRTALVHRERRISYHTANELMDQIASGLGAVGVARGQSVALMLKNCPEFILAQSGIGRLGGSAVSTSWRSTAQEMRFLIENSGARALLFDASVADVVRELAPQVSGQLGDRLYAVGGEVDGFQRFDDLLAAGKDGEANVDAGDEAAVIIYTSGTTGKPKGAVRRAGPDASHTIFNFFLATPMRVHQRHLVVCPLYHSTAFGFSTLSMLLGSTVVIADGFEPEGFVDMLEEHRIHHTALVPTMLHRVLSNVGADEIRARNLSHLVAMFTGGAPLSAELATRVLDAFGEVLFQFYGATETGLVTLASPKHLRDAPGTIGKVLGGNDVRLIDDAGKICGVDEVGELYVKSGNLVEGYHANDDATRDSMRDGYFSVGDLARCDARGYFFIEGRKRDMIISGGVNVYPREVEAVLSAHPRIGEAAVLGLPDEEWGERVHAFVALEGASPAPEEHESIVADILAFCRERLAGPKRPRGVTIMDSLPRNPTGKVLKGELRELLSGGAA